MHGFSGLQIDVFLRRQSTIRSKKLKFCSAAASGKGKRPTPTDRQNFKFAIPISTSTLFCSSNNWFILLDELSFKDSLINHYWVLIPALFLSTRIHSSARRQQNSSAFGLQTNSDSSTVVPALILLEYIQFTSSTFLKPHYNMGTVENRSRKSTLSRIGSKIFGHHEDKNSSKIKSTNESDKIHSPASASSSTSSLNNSSNSPLNTENLNEKLPNSNRSQPKPIRSPQESIDAVSVGGAGFNQELRSFSNSSSINSSSSSLNQLEYKASHNNYNPNPPRTTISSTPSRASSIKLPTNPSTKKSPNFSAIENNKLSRIQSNVQLNRSPSTASTAHLPVKQFSRFTIFDDGTHEHHLKNAKRQEKLSNMLKNLWVGQKLRDEAKSAVPEILTNNPPTLFSGLVNQMSEPTDDPISGATTVQGQILDPSNSAQFHNKTFAERYGRCQEVVGKGTFGVVRISHKKDHDKETLYAVKEFKRKPNETDSKYSRRLTSEFCISSSLKHVNIVETLDLLQDAKGDYVEVMEFCSGGDLYTMIIAAGKLEYQEADCFFKQLIRGVVYMHSMGVAHRDLKPENLLLTENGVLKITDFGNAECFRMAWETEVHLSHGICGSSPYIAPEEYTSDEFDPRHVDIWSCGVIYMAMRTGRQLWRTANSDDEFYLRYLEGRKSAKGYEPIELLKRARCRNVIYSILDPVASRRITGKQILNSEWGREVICCVNTGAIKTTPAVSVAAI